MRASLKASGLWKMYFLYLCVHLFVPLTFLKYEGVWLKQDARRQVDFERPGFTVGAGWNKIALKIPSKANIYIYMWFKTCTFWRKRFNFKAKGHSGHLDFWGTHSSEYWAFSPPLFWYAIKAIQKEFKAKCWGKILFCMKCKHSSEDDTQIMLKGRLLLPACDESLRQICLRCFTELYWYWDKHWNTDCFERRLACLKLPPACDESLRSFWDKYILQFWQNYLEIGTNTETQIVLNCLFEAYTHLWWKFEKLLRQIYFTILTKSFRNWDRCWNADRFKRPLACLKLLPACDESLRSFWDKYISQFWQNHLEIGTYTETQIVLNGRLLVWSFYRPVMKVWEAFENV